MGRARRGLMPFHRRTVRNFLRNRRDARWLDDMRVWLRRLKHSLAVRLFQCLVNLTHDFLSRRVVARGLGSSAGRKIVNRSRRRPSTRSPGSLFMSDQAPGTAMGETWSNWNSFAASSTTFAGTGLTPSANELIKA